ncbi:hypothetical protein SGRIM128S_04645 [Streptomyces griseomycini]
MAVKPRTPNSRSSAARSPSSFRYVIGHSTPPVSGPSASKYAHTLRSTRSGMKCVCTSTSPGSPSPSQKRRTSRASVRVSG